MLRASDCDKLPDRGLASIWKIPWLRQLRCRVRRRLQTAATPILANYIKFAITTSTGRAD
jgi:hypothetical protein